MSAVMSRPLADYTSSDLRSIDELDAAICDLAKQMNIDCYRMLVLVREFDDRFGWMKWSFKKPCCFTMRSRRRCPTSRSAAGRFAMWRRSRLTMRDARGRGGR